MASRNDPSSRTASRHISSLVLPSRLHISTQPSFSIRPNSAQLSASSGNSLTNASIHSLASSYFFNRPRIDRLGRELSQFFPILLQARGIWNGAIRRILLDMVTERAVGVDIEWHMLATACDLNHASPPQRMAHPELVPNIWIVDGQVSDDQVGKQQLLKHIRM